MTNYLNPLSSRIKSIILRSFNDGVDLLRSPIRRPDILLVTGSASPEKIWEAENRLIFLLAHISPSFGIRQVCKASPLDYLRYTGVATAETGAIFTFASRRLRWVVDIDHESNPHDGWHLADLGTAVSRRPSRKALRDARRRLRAHVRKLNAEGPRPVYLFGTGPSLCLASERSFGDGNTIVCNTIVRDRDLWHHLAPSFLAAGDPIYHFGHTPHARAFRADALQRLKESKGQTLFVYPAQFDLVVRAEFYEVESSLIPIPLGEHSDPAVDLTKHFSLPPLDNVLSALLLPLGCTLSNDVRLWGFDGRAPDDDGFWLNSSRQSYPELMQSMRDAHPAFFEHHVPQGREVDYVNKVHGDLLDQRLTDAEGRGFQFRMLHPSWTPTFQKRYQSVPPASD